VAVVVGEGFDGVFFLPLTVLRLVRGLGLEGWGRVASRRWGCGPGLGWSGRCGGWPAGGFEEAGPFVLAVPAFGQVQGDAVPAVAGGPRGDGDQVAADGRRAGPGVAAAGQGAGGAQQVAGDGGDGEPGGVGVEFPVGYL
jgi:hypothetical protein